MLWDVKGFVKRVVGSGCSAIVRGAISLWGMLLRLASAVGLLIITVGAFMALVVKYVGSAVVQLLRMVGRLFVAVGAFLKPLFAWRELSLHMSKAAKFSVRGLRVVISSIVPGILLVSRLVAMVCRWVWAGLVASVRWLGGTAAFLGTVFKRMLSWQGIVQGSGRAVQAVRAFPRAFVNRAVLLNPPFYLVYTAVSLVVLLAIGSLVYWQYGNVFTRYALAQHQAIDQKAMGTVASGTAAQQEAVDELQDIQNRLEARITATEQRLKELEMKTVNLEKQTEEQLEDVTQSVDERVGNFEQKAQKFVSVVEQKTKALDQQATQQKAAFAQTVAKVEKHVSAIDARAQKLDAMSHDVHKTVAALSKTTKQQVDTLARSVDEKTGAVERKVQQQVATLHQKVAHDIDTVTTKQAQHATKVIERLDALDESNKELATQTQQEVAQVHKKIDTTHQATQQKLTHLEKSINEKTAAVDQKVHKQMATLEHKVTTDIETGIAKHAQHIAKVDEKVAGLHTAMKQRVDTLETSINEKTTAVAAQAKQQLAQATEQIKETQHQIKAVNQKTAEVDSRVGTLERADVQEARRLSVIGHQVQQEVDAQMKSLREQATDRKKKADRKKVLERFLDQLAESED